MDVAEIWVRPSWTDKRIELLKKYWADGLSCSDIAYRLGGITRNSVIGKVSRLGLPGRITPRRLPLVHRSRRPKRLPKPGRNAFNSWPVYGQHAPRFSTEPLPPAQDYDVPRKTLADLDERRDCKFPVGDNADGPQMFCALPRHENLAYCEVHARRCFGAPVVRKHRAPDKPGGQLIRIAGAMNFEDVA